MAAHIHQHRQTLWSYDHAAMDRVILPYVREPEGKFGEVTEVQWAMATRFKPDTDIVLLPKCFGHELNPSTE
ncbi:hypothetical protein [Paradesulfitobacterium ferrireducens]|uniref:hypothetical protein n=1 Tax=Paradesulfitobacterium ferrireducens TaxID=2816476 RepID=UPI001A8EC0AC|nr:hypothetical protein [Paradesulfitobacterium ferrireducens]